MSLNIRRLDAGAADFEAQLDRLLAWDEVSDDAVARTVDEIIARVREQGDRALIDYTNRFDRRQVREAAELEIPP